MSIGMKLSIVMPVYNEEKTLLPIIDYVRRAELPKEILETEIIIVDDCSTDRTRDILREFDPELDDDIRIFYHETNQGKGGALKTGFEQVTGDIVIIQDADLEYDPNEYIKLLLPIIDGKADVVYGSRFIGGESHRILYFWHMIANRILTLISNMFSDLNLSDMETCYKVFRKKVIDKIDIEEKRFGIEPEITAKVAYMARNNGVRIYEIGISYYGRTYEEGKKIRLKDAIRALLCIIKYNNSKFARLVKYGCNGFVVASSQILTIFVLVNYFNLNTFFLKNVSHALSVEISIIVGFFMHSTISWRYKFRSAIDIMHKMTTFHLVTATSFVIRQIMFYISIGIGIDYMSATLISVLIAIVINFLGYDKYVFEGKK
jgi:glycosyltransferase involved in cell wall biosynthesis